MADKTTTQTSVKPANSTTSVASLSAPTSRPPRARSTVAKRVAAKTTAPRRVAQGDTFGATTAQGMAKKVSQDQVDAAQGAQQSALLDILAKSTDKAAVLETFLAGSSPDDVAAIRKMLANGQLLTGKKGPKPDEELASDWRKGGYPYKI